MPREAEVDNTEKLFLSLSPITYFLIFRILRNLKIFPFSSQKNLHSIYKVLLPQS